MTRYEYTVTATQRRTRETRSHVCWGDNASDAIDHARTVMELVMPHWKFKAKRTGKSEHVWRPKER